MTTRPRERATDRFGVTHQVADASWGLLATTCGIKSRWKDRYPRPFSHNLMSWDGFDPTPDVSCMACVAAEGAR